MEYTHDNPLRVVTLCSGYDSQCMALERLKEKYPPFDYELVAWAEFDPESKKPIERQAAVIAHDAVFPQWAGRNLGDITKVDWENNPLLKGKRVDLLFYSTPCQSISQAGLQHGFSEGSGTRSSIIWTVRDALIALKPKYACLENVEAMVSQKFRPMFNLWQREVERLGYSNFAKVLNAKNYGVPQNRARIFLMSILDPEYKANYNWPKQIPLKNKLGDLLENNVDTIYYLNPNKVAAFVEDNMSKINEYIREDDGTIEKIPEHLKEWLDNYKEEKVEIRKSAEIKKEYIDFINSGGECILAYIPYGWEQEVSHIIPGDEALKKLEEYGVYRVGGKSIEWATKIDDGSRVLKFITNDRDEYFFGEE